MEIRLLNADDIAAALPMQEAVDVMRRAYGEISGKTAVLPLRSRIETGLGTSLIMPAYLRESRELAVQLSSLFGSNPERGLPVVNGALLVVDPDTGLPISLMDGNRLTALRTGAGGGLAAELLSRRDSGVVALFGAGVQARSQLAAVMAVRTIREVRIFSRTAASAEALAAEIAEDDSPPAVTVSASPKAAVKGADIVIAATTSKTPVFDGDDIEPGMHVTGVGSFTVEMQEVDEKTLKKARVVVDSREACLAEAGDIVIPGIPIDAEIGEIVNGDKPGRKKDAEITYFKSVGVATQDAAAAAAVLAAAEKKELGTLYRLS